MTYLKLKKKKKVGTNPVTHKIPQTSLSYKVPDSVASYSTGNWNSFIMGMKFNPSNFAPFILFKCQNVLNGKDISFPSKCVSIDLLNTVFRE